MMYFKQKYMTEGIQYIYITEGIIASLGLRYIIAIFSSMHLNEIYNDDMMQITCILSVLVGVGESQKIWPNCYRNKYIEKQNDLFSNALYI